MAFTSFLGRVFFASVFILSAYQEFLGRVVSLKSRCLLLCSYNEYMVDGGHAVKALKPKVDVFAAHVNSHTGIHLPHFDTQYIVCASIALKGTGSVLFILGSSFGAYNLFLHQIVATPILYDFYNYDRESKEFNQLFIKFTQNVALLGALLFFIGMKISSPRRRPRRKVTKPKTV